MRYIVVQDKTNKCNGYIRTFSNGETQYEHRVIAAEMIGRPLRDNEDVHHLDSNRENNSPENLLVLESSQHAKLHTWLDKNLVISKPSYAIRKLKGCIRCKECSKPINDGFVFCGEACSKLNIQKTSKLAAITKDELEQLVNKAPFTTIAKELGVSDNGVRKKCAALGVEIPIREKGFWTKVKHGLICPT